MLSYVISVTSNSLHIIAKKLSFLQKDPNKTYVLSISHYYFNWFSSVRFSFLKFQAWKGMNGVLRNNQIFNDCDYAIIIFESEQNKVLEYK